MSRALMMSTGASFMLVLIAIAALLLPQPAIRHSAPARRVHRRCTQDAFISVIHVCSGRVYETNPDGARVLVGGVQQLYAPHAHVLMAVR